MSREKATIVALANALTESWEQVDDALRDGDRMSVLLADIAEILDYEGSWSDLPRLIKERVKAK